MSGNPEEDSEIHFADNWENTNPKGIPAFLEGSMRFIGKAQYYYS